MRTKILSILAIIILLGAAVSAHVGVADAKAGIIHIAEVMLGTSSNGTASEFQCNMPGDGMSFRINEATNSVQFVIHCRFTNGRSSGNQKFVVGYKVWKQSGNSWNLVADGDRAVDRTVSASNTISGDCTVPRVSLSGGGDVFRVALTYEITGVRNSYQTRTFRVDRSL